MNNPLRNKAMVLSDGLLKTVATDGANAGCITYAILALVYAVLSHHKDRD